ncbi:retrovirus-related pol polyprotein from transposon TNT 1-94 [Tanacetum coccineum]
MFVLLDDQMNSVINCLTARSTWDDLILYHEGPSDVKESRVMDLKNTNHVKDSELASLFGKLKYEENLIDSIYETEKNESLVSATPLSTAFISTSSVQDVKDIPDDEEDTRSSHEYLNNPKEKYQARALLAKSKRFFKKGTQRFINAKATGQTECHKCSKKVHFERDCWSKALVPSYQSPFQPKPLNSSQHKSKLRSTKDFEAKYNKVKAKLALLSSSASASKATTIKNKGLNAKAYKWDEEEGSSDDNEMVEVKVLMVHTLLEMKDNDDRKTYLDYLCIYLNYVEEQRNNLLSKHIDLVHELIACKEQLLVLKQAKLDFLTMQHVNIEILKENKNLRTELKELTAITKTWLNSSNKVNQCISEQIPSQKKRILGVDQLTKDPSNSRQKDIVFVKSLADDTKVSIPTKSQRNIIDPLVAVTDSSATEYDSTDESLVCSNPLPPLKKLDGVEPISGSKTIKSVLRSKSTFKAETLKGVKINEPSLAPAKGNKSSSTSKVNSALASKLKSVKIKDDPPLAICNIRKPIWYLDSGCSRHMTGVKSYLHKYEEQPGPKVVFGDDSTCTTKGYGSIKCNGILFTKFNEKRGTIFNSNKEVIIIAPRVRDVYVLDMTSSAPKSCFFAKASDNLNWFWHKRLAHLNFKTINKLAKQNLVIGHPSLVYSKDKPCSSCEKGKLHRASFKTKQTSSIKKCLHLLHMDLFRPVTPRFINHEKYTLVTVDECSRPSESSTQEDSKLNKPITSYLMKAPMLSNSQNLQLTTSTLLKMKDIHLMNIFILMSLLKVSSDQNGQTNQNDQSIQNDEILNDGHSEHSNHTNDEQIIDNLPNTKDIQIFKHSSSLRIEFTFEEIAFITNNKVALLYRSHPNSGYFKEVSDFISKGYLKEAFIKVSTPTGGIRGDIGINIFRNDLRAHYLPYSSMYVSPPSITIVRPWFATIGYSGDIKAKGTLKKSCLPLRWRLLMGQVIQCLGGKIGGLDQISNKDATIMYCLANGVKVDYVRLIWKDIIHKLSKKTREKVVPYPRFISLLLEYMMPEYDNEELTRNPTQVFSVYNCALKPNQTEGPPFTDHMKAICNLDLPVDSKAPKPSSQTKEVPQGKKPRAKSGLRRKIFQNTHLRPRLRHLNLKLANQKKKLNPQASSGLTSLGATSVEGAHPQLSSGHDALANSTAEADPGLSAPNDSIPSQQDESEEEKEVAKDKDTHASSHDVPEDTSIPHSPSLKLAQIQELMAHARPSYPDINHLTNLLVTSLKPELSKLLASHNFSSCLPTKLKELPSKFTELSREIKELKQHVKDMEIKLPGDLNEIPTKLSIKQGQATASPAEGKKNTTKDAETNLQNGLVNILGIDVVEQYHNKKLLFDKYCDKMLKRRKSLKIINCDVITQKGPISLKVVQACPDRKEKGWKTIYGLIKTRMEYLDQTERELKTDFNKPLKEQDPLNELNELAKKKIKRTSDL